MNTDGSFEELQPLDPWGAVIILCDLRKELDKTDDPALKADIEREMKQIENQLAEEADAE